jgi:hypothetical protein
MPLSILTGQRFGRLLGSGEWREDSTCFSQENCSLVKADLLSLIDENLPIHLGVIIKKGDNADLKPPCSVPEGTGGPRSLCAIELQVVQIQNSIHCDSSASRSLGIPMRPNDNNIIMQSILDFTELRENDRVLQSNTTRYWH